MIQSKEIKLVSRTEVKLNPKNRNKHHKEQIDRLADIISYQGFRNPLIVSNRTGLLVAGHGRLEAAKKLKLKEVPVMYQDFENEDQEYACMVSDNAIASWSELDLSGINADIGMLGPDFNIDMLGIKGFEIDKLSDEPGCDEDAVPEYVEPKSKLGDLYQLGEHRLLCGDSTSIDAVEKLMILRKAQMAFTDPPYGIAVDNTQGEIMGDGDLNVFKDCLPLLKAYSDQNAHFYVWCAAGDMLPPSLAAFADVFQFQNLLPVRCTHENKRGNKGAFKNNYEVCLFGNDNSKGFNESQKFSVSEATKKDSRYEGSGFLKVYPALWDGERATEHNMNIIHPTQKKVEMIEFYVEISSNPNELVLDLFGGSGSTLIACEKTNRKCFMMELDPHYCDVIVARWEKYTSKKAELING